MDNETKSEPTEREPKPCTLARRSIAIAYDSILVAGVLLLASIPVVSVLRIVQGSTLYPLYILYLYVCSLLYFGWFWTKGRRTLGMISWKVKISQTNGDALGWGQAMFRYLLATGWLFALSIATQFPHWTTPGHLNLIFWASLIVILAGIFRSPDRRSYYDYLAGTQLTTE